jgi:hypothetical protein
MLCGVPTGRTKVTPMRTLRRLATATPHPLAAWRLELLTAAALLGGVVGMLTGAY